MRTSLTARASEEAGANPDSRIRDTLGDMLDRLAAQVHKAESFTITLTIRKEARRRANRDDRQPAKPRRRRRHPHTG